MDGWIDRWMGRSVDELAGQCIGELAGRPQDPNADPTD